MQVDAFVKRISEKMQLILCNSSAFRLHCYNFTHSVRRKVFTYREKNDMIIKVA